MTGTQTLAARAALGVAFGGVSLVLVSLRRLFALGEHAFDRGVLMAYAVSRLGLFGLVFLVLHIPPRGDIPSYYMPEGESALRGLMPYRDFASSYGPLHPYMDAAVLRVWNSPVALIGFALLIELVTLALFLTLGRQLFADRRVRVAALLYLASPLSMQFVCIDGQDNVLLALLLGLALWAALRSRDVLSGVAAGAGASLLKVLALFYAPVFFFARARRWRWTAGFVLALVAGYGLFVALRLPLLVPIQIESSMKQAGDLPFLVESVLGVDIPGKLLDLIMLLGVAAVWLLVARNARGAGEMARSRIILFGLPAVTLVLELLAKKSWPPYLMIVLFPLALVVAGGSRWRVLLFEVFSVVAVTEHSYWATILGSFGSAEMHRGLVLQQHAPWIYLASQVLLLAGYGWLLWLTLSAVARERSSPSGQPGYEVSGRAARRDEGRIVA